LVYFESPAAGEWKLRVVAAGDREIQQGLLTVISNTRKASLETEIVGDYQNNDLRVRLYPEFVSGLRDLDRAGVLLEGPNGVKEVIEADQVSEHGVYVAHLPETVPTAGTYKVSSIVNTGSETTNSPGEADFFGSPSNSVSVPQMELSDTTSFFVGDP
jgi:hypothetical protein